MLSLTGQIFIVTKNTGSQMSRLHPRIAGISPASGCTQPLMREVKISTAFWFAYRQKAGETPAIRRSRGSKNTIHRLKRLKRFFLILRDKRDSRGKISENFWKF
ncbi:MAG: hypothetical protein LBP59_15875 [Planctomycetaceae bacterium]|nr:hypothetical protein [Planctomycetaceae bacterium]